MRKFIAGSLAALTFAGAIATGSAASAQQRYRHHNDHGDAVAAGIAGLAVGAAIASSNNNRYGYRDGYYYGPRTNAYQYYYGPSYYGPRQCRTREVWDPYLRGYVEQTRCHRY